MPTKVLCKFCACESAAETLARWQLWPVDVKKPNLCFSFGLLEWMRFLLLECHVSKSAFIEVIKWKNNLTSEEVTFIPLTCVILAQNKVIFCNIFY